VTPEERLARLLDEEEETIDLARAALAVARLGRPELREETFLARLDELGAAARAAVGAATEPRWVVAALNRVLFEDEGFRPNALDFDDPSNSYLDRVLERRTGIPISLSVVFMEVALRAGIACEGVGLPFHFIVRVFGPDERSALVDPYHQGRMLQVDDCARIVEDLSGGTVEFQPGFLRGVTKRQVVARLLTNLKVCHWRNRRLEEALAVEDMILAVRAEDPRELRDRGRLRLWTGRYRGAVEDLERYLALVPAATDADEIRADLAEARRGMSEPEA
jgi:regulator of sirC expression with transglutaminase-like and TPR domain